MDPCASPGTTAAAVAMTAMLSHAPKTRTSPGATATRIRRRAIPYSPEVSPREAAIIFTQGISKDSGSSTPLIAQVVEEVSPTEVKPARGKRKLSPNDGDYNRKDKSLALLCENFLRLYGCGKTATICLDQDSSRCRVRGAVRQEKSLIIHSKKFVRLFLKSHPFGFNTEEVSLDDAAKQLLGDDDDTQKHKTKVRRLYDIANILSSLGLIEKVQLHSTRKPAFKWCYTLGSAPAMPLGPVQVPSDAKISKKRCVARSSPSMPYPIEAPSWPAASFIPLRDPPQASILSRPELAVPVFCHSSTISAAESPPLGPRAVDGNVRRAQPGPNTPQRSPLCGAMVALLGVAAEEHKNRKPPSIARNFQSRIAEGSSSAPGGMRYPQGPTQAVHAAPAGFAVPLARLGMAPYANSGGLAAPHGKASWMDDPRMKATAQRIVAQQSSALDPRIMSVAQRVVQAASGGQPVGTSWKPSPIGPVSLGLHGTGMPVSGMPTRAIPTGPPQPISSICPTLVQGMPTRFPSSSSSGTAISPLLSGPSPSAGVHQLVSVSAGPLASTTPGQVLQISPILAHAEQPATPCVQPKLNPCTATNTKAPKPAFPGGPVASIVEAQKEEPHPVSQLTVLHLHNGRQGRQFPSVSISDSTTPRESAAMA